MSHAYEIIEIVISTLSLLACFFMIYIYRKYPTFKIFSYATQFYILMGAVLFTVLDFMFNSYILEAFNTVSQTTANIDFETSMCEITSYVSSYGIMNMVCWQTVLVSVAKQAVLQRKTEQFSGHVQFSLTEIYLVSFAFFAPLMFTIIPQLSNESIYGPYKNVCWLSYYSGSESMKCTKNSHILEKICDHKYQSQPNKSYIIIIFSLLFYFIPIIYQCIKQLMDIKDMEKDINKISYTIRQSETGQQNSYIKAIKSLKILSTFFLIVVTIPAILFFLSLFEVYVNQQWIFQIFKGMLSATALILLFAFSRNDYLVLKCKQAFKKQPKNTLLNNSFVNKNSDTHSDHMIDFFQGIDK